MILKSYQLNKIDIKRNKFILFYGKNIGVKIEAIDFLKKKFSEKNFLAYDENQILDNSELFFNNILSGSLFENKKQILINRATDKITKIFEYLLEKNLENTTIIVNAETLEKRSKLRSLFEKNEDMIIVPFYEDTFADLNKIVINFTKEKKISLSQFDINLIINNCNGDRINLMNELEKIEQYSKYNKKISTEVLKKLINLAENHSLNELINNCLAKNKKKTLDIINENNYNNDDCILIIRTFLNKSKNILKLLNTYKINKNIHLTISGAKPPIFWKEKEITKQQLLKWEPENLKELIYKLNEIELNVKKNINNSIDIITDLILELAAE